MPRTAVSVAYHGRPSQEKMACVCRQSAAILQREALLFLIKLFFPLRNFQFREAS